MTTQINTLQYNELSQLKARYLNGTATSYLQRQLYYYNVRGWLTRINDPNVVGNDLFSQRLYYNTVPSYCSALATGRFNGNISTMEWFTKNTVPTNYHHGYGYQYDGLNRLKAGHFFARLNTSGGSQEEPGGASNQDYGTITSIGSEKDITYDKNGNILTLKRYGSRADGLVLFDQLSYQYSGNRLMKVIDAITGLNSLGDFRNTTPPTSLNEFDANGNLVFDVDRNMQLHYSTRNLPLDIVFDEGLIRNTYRPDGVCRIGLISRFYSMARLSALTASKRICCANSLRISKKTNKKVYDGKGRLTTNETYLGNLVLNFGVPSQILHPEGVVDVSNLSQPVAHYHLKDHLGNVRAVVNPSATNTALISQTNDYYPFGMCYTKNPGSFTNKKKYNGKEEQEMPGRWLDYGARFYDPQLGRWHGVDPLAEKYRRWTPYNYCVNNPMRFVDPDGMGVDDIYNHAGKYMGTVGSGNNIRILNATQTQFNTMNEDYIMSRSRVVNIQSDEQVTSVINHISTETNNGDVERKAYIVLDTENATLSLDIQPITAGDTKHDSENLYEGPVKIGDASYNKPLGGSDYDVIVGQVHAHNTDKSGIMMGGSTTGYVQSSESIRAGTSEPDKASAMKLGVPVHAIDGNNQQINRVDQNGRESSSVSKEGLLRKSLEIYGGRSI